MKAPNENDLIRAACDLHYVAEVFRDSAALDPALQGFQIRSATMVRHKKGKRCLIKYSGIDDSGVKLEFLGKIRFKGRDLRTPALQRELRSAGFDGVQGFSVPQVYGELPALNMWLQEFVGNGIQVSMNSNDFIASQERVASSLARLHRTPISTTKRHTIDDELALLESRFQLLRHSRPELGHLLDELQTSTLKIARTLEASSLLTTIHRDFYFDQVLVSQSQTVLVDLDLCCIGPPELDVGNYIGHLREYAIRCQDFEKTCEAAEGVFMNSYFAHMRQASRTAAERWAILTLARHVSLSSTMPGRYHTTVALAKQTLSACGAQLPSESIRPVRN